MLKFHYKTNINFNFHKKQNSIIISQETQNTPTITKQLPGLHQGSKILVGYLKLTYSFDSTDGQISVSASLKDVKIGTRGLYSKSSSIGEISDSVGILEAKLEFTVYPTQKTLEYTYDLKDLGSTIYKGSETVFGW
jgi:hypothetical protein